MQTTSCDSPSETTRAPRILTVSDLCDELLVENAAAERALLEGRRLGPTIAHEQLAAQLGGYWPPGLITFHAGTGCGKSAFALEAAAEAECPVVYVTVEMPGAEIMRRLVARATDTFKGKLNPGKTPTADLIRLVDRAKAKTSHITVIDASMSPVPLKTIAATIDALRERTGDPNVLCVVDSVQAWAAQSMDSAASEYETLSLAIAQLNAFAISRRCPVLLLSERSRFMVEGGVSAGAGTRKLEYVPVALLELDRPPEDENAVDDGDLVVLTIAKNRSNGRSGVKIPLRFNGGLQRFTETDAADLPTDLSTRRARRRSRASGAA